MLCCNLIICCFEKYDTYWKCGEKKLCHLNLYCSAAGSFSLSHNHNFNVVSGVKKNETYIHSFFLLPFQIDINGFRDARSTARIHYDFFSQASCNFFPLYSLCCRKKIAIDASGFFCCEDDCEDG